MPAPTQEDEVAYISGVNADGTMAATSYAAWDGSDPAGYGTSGYFDKWFLNASSNVAGTPGGNVTFYFDPASNWTNAEKQVFEDGLALWSAIANITFTLTTQAAGAQLTIARGSDEEAYTNWDTSPGSGEEPVGGTVIGQITSASISIDTNGLGFGPIGAFSGDGRYPLMTVVHEEGHVLGLEHDGPYNFNVNAHTDQFSPYDVRQWSVMSYIDPSQTGAKYYADYPVHATYGGAAVPVTWMPLDILAAQRLYGMPTSTPLSGGQIFGFHTNLTGDIQPFFDFTQDTSPIITLWDMGTGNTLDLSGFGANATVNLNPGTYSSAAGRTNNIAIAYGTAIDSLVGGSGNDTITANNDGDTITAGGGDDTIFGGTGLDTAVYSANRAGYSVTRNAGGYIVSGPDGTDTLNGVDRLAFADQTMTLSASHPPEDFNGDTSADLLMQYSDGRIAIWLTSGMAFAGGSLVGSPGVAWQAVDAGDFDGDGKSDILMQRDDGTLAVWLMNGTAMVEGAAIGNPGINWRAKATADFNGDGKSDILMQYNDGSIAIWLDNGLSMVGGGLVGNPGSAWHIRATGDLNGDGKADIVLQRDTGEIAVWSMDGLSLMAGTLAGDPGASWQVEAAADLDGDGKDDLILQNTDSSVAVWLMDGATVRRGAVIATPGTAWHVQTAGDANANGKSDIFLQRTSGEVAVWNMNGAALVSSAVIGNPGAAWAVVGPTGG